MSHDKVSMVKDSLRNLAPQYYNPDTGKYEPLEGENGGSKVRVTGGNTHQTVSANATTVASLAEFNVNYIVFISNDGEESITFNIDSETDQEGAFTLHAGEVLSDLPRSCTKLHFKAASGTQAFRALGVM